jgi:replicative DNA helicase
MARRMKLSEDVAGLSERVDKLDRRFDRFEARVDERFNAVDERFNAVDERFDGVDVRFDELRRHFDVIAETSRDDFRNLYDLFQAHMHRMEARTDTLAVTLRGEMKLGYDALDSRVTVLERNDQPGHRRTRR